jgi:hypothetical protein
MCREGQGSKSVKAYVLRNEDFFGDKVAHDIQIRRRREQNLWSLPPEEFRSDQLFLAGKRLIRRVWTDVAMC